MGNLGTIRIGSSEHGASSYLTLVNTATSGSMYEQNRILKDFHFIDDKSRLHSENLKNSAQINKEDSAKWKQTIVKPTSESKILNEKNPQTQLLKPTLINAISSNLSSSNLNIISASSLMLGNITIKKPYESKRKNKKEYNKDKNDNQVHEKDNISLLIFWEFEASKN